MLRALLYLRFTSLQNWLLWRGRRLRQPKYLVGAIVGVAYFYFFFVRRISTARHVAVPARFHAVDPMMVAGPAEWAQLAMALGAAALLVVFACMWIVPTRRAALGFSEAEIAFLFPAPISRRALVHFRLVSGQFRSLGGALILALLSNRWTFLGGNPLTHAFGWWFIFSALSLHYNGATFAFTRLADRGFNVPLRRVVVLALLVAVFAAAFWRLPPGHQWPRFDGLAGAMPLSEWIVAFTSTSPLSVLLYPLRLILAPFLALDLRTFLIALGPCLLVLALHYFWVVQTAMAFEEASIERAQRRAARIAAWRSGERRFTRLPTQARPAPFPLAETGRPEVALLWKNLLSTWRYFNRRVFLGTAVVIIVGAVWTRQNAGWANVGTAVAGIAAVVAGYVAIIGPQFARQDLRSDLRNLDVLKTYPLPGWQIVLGEILTPMAILAGIVWLALLAFVLLVDARGAVAWLTPGLRLALVGGFALLTPPLLTLQLLVPNAGALVFPSWFAAGRTRGGGIEVMGQRLIFFFAQALTMAIVLIPAAIVAALFLLTIYVGVPKPLAIATATVMAAAVLVGEVAAGVWWLGTRFEKIDVSEEIRS